MKERLRRVGPIAMAIMRCLLLISCLFCSLASSLAAAPDRLSSRFCLVPIRGGTPTEKDFNDAWRMVSKVIMLPGVPRPVIYAYNRGGVWTIDDNRALVPFGGEFPSNPILDQIAHDPESGRVIGVNSAVGIFAMDPGQSLFRKLYGLSDTPLRHPNSVEFIPRFKGFVISDHTGLYLLDRAGALSPLPIADHATLGAPSRVFDLPAFDALVVNAQNSSAVVRYDGEVIHVATLDRFDFARGVNVEADGSVSIHGNRKTYTVRLSRESRKPIVQGRSFVVGEAPLHLSHTRLSAPSIGKTIAIRRSGLVELGSSGPIPIVLPFDAAREPIRAVTEIPEYRAVFILTAASAYALQDDGSVTEIPGARDVGVSRLGPLLGLIPVRNETIFLGRNRLNLLLDKRISGEAACDGAG
ncbi:hypothetical protein [Bradyrhizobium sp. CB1015]|uniref:hypothetical protein n=1 Tax=Bradyrhizobium sp. CB1015 TaxID=2976822 RepID=UPI0021AAE2C3|nr:hypothetical protein [Bradyrhizobium sp. CB1015]UWU94035.1 hypothetical protein N2604_09340 [Bradyrhizobium sp. CB1015]